LAKQFLRERGGERKRERERIFLKKLPPNTLAWFDLTSHSSNLLGGRRRRYHIFIAPALPELFGENPC
jgi:hypothetical protein